jgi:hypothetical protein
MLHLVLQMLQAYASQCVSTQALKVPLFISYSMLSLSTLQFLEELKRFTVECEVPERSMASSAAQVRALETLSTQVLELATCNQLGSIIVPARHSYKFCVNCTVNE